MRLRQVDLAKRVGRPQSYVSKIESGERRVDVVELIELLDAMGVDQRAFFEQVRGLR